MILDKSHFIQIITIVDLEPLKFNGFLSDTFYEIQLIDEYSW